MRRLEVFSAVTKHLNVSRAARESHVAPSAASHAVKKLERDLGVKLILQTRRTIELIDSVFSIETESMRYFRGYGLYRFARCW